MAVAIQSNIERQRNSRQRVRFHTSRVSETIHTPKSMYRNVGQFFRLNNAKKTLFARARVVSTALDTCTQFYLVKLKQTKWPAAAAVTISSACNAIFSFLYTFGPRFMCLALRSPLHSVRIGPFVSRNSTALIHRATSSFSVNTSACV